MTDTVNIVIGVGHEEGGETQSAARAKAFGELLRHAVVWEGGTVDAYVSGSAYSTGWGREPATWIAATLPAGRVGALKLALRIIARQYGQEAIALTVGQTDYIYA